MVISFETAKELAGKIELVCDAGYDENGNLVVQGGTYPAPEVEDLRNWILENKKIFIEVLYDYEYDSTPYHYYLRKLGQGQGRGAWEKDFSKPVEAIEAAMIEIFTAPEEPRISVEVLEKVAERISLLNKFVKSPDFPISKNNFYKIKAGFLLYLYRNPQDGVKFIINGTDVNENGGEFACIKVQFSDNVYEFHSPIIGQSFPKIEPIGKLKERVFYNISMTGNEILKYYQELIGIIEDNSWFVYDYMSPLQFAKTMKSSYPGLNIEFPGKGKKIVKYGGNKVKFVRKFKYYIGDIIKKYSAEFEISFREDYNLEKVITI